MGIALLLPVLLPQSFQLEARVARIEQAVAGMGVEAAGQSQAPAADEEAFRTRLALVESALATHQESVKLAALARSGALSGEARRRDVPRFRIEGPIPAPAARQTPVGQPRPMTLGGGQAPGGNRDGAGASAPPKTDPAKVLLQIEGVPVTFGEIDGYIDFLAETSRAPRERLAIDVLDRCLIPLVAVKARYGGRLEELEKRATAAQARLKAGEDFGKIAREVSDDTASAARGGDLQGAFGRDAMVLPFARAAFTLGEGEVSGTIWTRHGLHLLQVTGSEAGPDGKPLRRAARHMLFSFESLDPDYVQTMGRILRGDISVVCVDPAWRNVIPPRYRR